MISSLTYPSLSLKKRKEKSFAQILISLQLIPIEMIETYTYIICVRRMYIF